MSLKGKHIVHFLGIGGIGMSAIARWCSLEGLRVSGYDRTPSMLTDSLQQEGIPVSFEDTVEAIPAEVLADSAKTLIIWTPAIPAESVQLNYLRERGFELKKRSEVLGFLTESTYTIAVAGTHGKTTTSCMIAHLLKSADFSITAFLGGITQNYGSNLIKTGKSKKPELLVVEADEFDRSFLKLHPSEAVITSADADHLDVYGDEDTILEGFRDFAKLISKKGKLFIQTGALQKLGEIQGRKLKVKEYGLRSLEIRAENIQARSDSFVFDFENGKEAISGIELFIPGYHNVENALAAISVARNHGVTPAQIREGMRSFRGVKRRFEIHIHQPDLVYIDDYAHHPEEIRSILSSVIAMYPGKSITVIFQPHLYSRTRDFAAGFSESLSLADRVWLLDIYPAREKPLAGITSEMLLLGIQTPEKEVVTKAQVLERLREINSGVVVTLGAGDIGRLVPEIALTLSTQINTKP